ncbi:phosphoribosylaminoimidazolesuccinocarboxamide synthase [candidate division KSB1 bacterium]|nr:phosphoribosylaminoimidazolesuccinocarboxamide synthase [candidate division KSB1 bacterium]
MEKRDLLFEGSSKRLYSTDRENLAVLEYTDDFIIQPNGSRTIVPGKGEVNLGIATFLFQYLENYHVPTHFVERIGKNDMLVRRLKMIPIEVVVYNAISSRLAQRFKLEDGHQIDFPIIEYFLKSPRLGNPMINETHALALGYAKPDDMRAMGRMASKANAILKSLFERRGLQLIEFKLEFGMSGENIYIGDEISPDTSRYFDRKRNRRLEREKYIQDLASVEKVYRELYDRLTRAV